MGLAIAKQLCTLLGGSIGVISQRGLGSNFWFTMNYAIGEDAEILPPADRGLVKHFNSSRNLKILVVDDNYINHAILENILTEVGHEVLTAGTGLAGIEDLRKNQFDLIIMDIQMPEMDGATATRMIRQFPGAKANIPIIACTADATDECREDYSSAGMNEIIIKPIDKSELYHAINNCLNEEIHFPVETNVTYTPKNLVHEEPKNNAQVLENILKEIGG